MRLRSFASFLTACALVLAGLVLAPATAHAAPSTGEYADQVVALINDARKKAGRPALKTSASLSSVATAWSKRMADAQKLSHNPSYSAQYPAGWKRAGENVAYGMNSQSLYPASRIHENLMNSPGHKANILQEAYTHVGVGVVFEVRNGRTYVWVTQNFATYTSVSPDASTPTNPVRSHERLAGDTRYETARAIGREAFPTSDEIVIVAGNQASVVDGLVAAPFAYHRKAPVLLAEKTRLGAATRAEVQRRGPSRAWLVGGTGVLSSGVVKELERLGVSDVRRLAGDNRYGTAAAVAERMPANSRAIVASGAQTNLIDAAAVSGPAAAAGRPIVLTDPRTLPKETAAVLKRRGTTHVTVIGGSGAVSSGVQNTLGRTMSTTRVGGDDRYSTATRVASQFASITGTDTAVVAAASDANLIDAMTGGVLAKPIVLTGRAPAAVTKRWVADRRVEHLVVVGGTGAVPTAAISELRRVR